MIKYAWKYNNGDYYAWGFRCKTLEAAELMDTVDDWQGMRADGKPVMVDVFAEAKYPWGSTRREVI